MKRNTVRRLAALLLAALLLLTACAQPPENTEDSTGDTQGTATVPSSTSTEPPETDPTVTEPDITEPTQTEPPQTEPSVPQPTDPQPTEPNPTDPKPTDPKPTEPDVGGVKEIKLTFVGDCTFGRNQKHTYSNSFDEMYDKKGSSYFFKKVRSIFENDDITVINLEGSLTTSTDIQDKTWNHKGDPKYVKIMTGSSVEVATMGNNHRLDYGVSGFEETMDVLEKADISYCYDDVYLVYEVKGVKVGFVSVNVVYDGWKVEAWLKEGHRKLREQGCQIVVACVHWGGDKTPVIDDYQMQLGHKAIDWGYDLVVGNHPHVLQAMEVYKGRFICYSLGNFCYGGNKNPADKDSGIFQQTFTIVDGELVRDANAQFIPCSLSGVDYRNDYQPTPVSGSEYQRIIEKMNGYSKKFGFALDDGGKPARMAGKVVSTHTHSYTGDGTVVAPTCTTQGYRIRTCICGEEEKTELTEPVGHQYGEFSGNHDATCTVDGTKTAKCTVCGTQVTVTDSGTAGHDYEAVLVTPATMWEEGYTTYTCTACGESYMGDFTERIHQDQFQRMVAAASVKHINLLRAEQGKGETISAPGLTLVAEYRVKQLMTNFESSEEALQEACTYYQYGELVADSYYTAYARESILRFSGSTTPETIGQEIAKLLQASDDWSVVGSAEYPYIGIGAAYDSGTGEWFISILQTVQNYG